MIANSSKEVETLLFLTRAPRITEACPVGSQFYVCDTDTYYIITQVELSGDIYALFGKQIDIPELTNEPVWMTDDSE